MKFPRRAYFNIAQLMFDHGVAGGSHRTDVRAKS